MSDFKLPLLSELILVGGVLAFLSASSTFAQAANDPPVPLWPADGNLPKSYGNRKVFLSSDEHSVIVLWPNQDGNGSKPVKMSLHNAIDPNLRVRIEKNVDAFVYQYNLENEKHSEDSITNFSVVVYPDPKIQLQTELAVPVKAISTVKKRIGIPGAPSGGLALWLFPEAQPLLPGQGTKFTLITPARPGFTTASTEHFPHLDLTDKWPQQILDELEPVLTPNWIDQHIITLGPRYAPDESAVRIAADYITGIQELMRNGHLMTSPFVKAALAELDAIAKGGAATYTVTSARPQTKLEAEIANALALSLNEASATR